MVNFQTVNGICEPGCRFLLSGYLFGNLAVRFESMFFLLDRLPDDLRDRVQPYARKAVKSEPTRDDDDTNS